MKQNEVKLGGTYLTYIGESLARVVVVRTQAPNGFHNRTRFVVQREGECKPLPKSRSAAALRPLPTHVNRDHADCAACVIERQEQTEA